MLARLLGPLVLLALLAAPVSAALSPPAVANLATQPLSVLLDSGEWKTICTVSAISRDGGPTDKLIGAQHCQIPNKLLYVGDKHAQVVQVVARDSGDTVVFRTKEVWKWSVKLAKRVPFDREHVFSYGFPRGFPKLYREGVFAGHYTVREDIGTLRGKRAFIFDINQGKGDSGSALMSKDAEVFCVLSYGVSYYEGFYLNMCVPPAFTPQQLKAIYGT